MLLFCSPADPKQLWMQFRAQICNDLQHKLRELGRTSVVDEDLYDFGLYLLDEILHDSSHSLSGIPSMFQPVHDWFSTLRNCLIAQQLNFDPESENVLGQEHVTSLTGD